MAVCEVGLWELPSLSSLLCLLSDHVKWQNLYELSLRIQGLQCACAAASPGCSAFSVRMHTQS